MSNDDDIDALLDDALDDFDTQQREAQAKSDADAASRQYSAKILEDTLNQQEGAAAAAQGQMDPEKMMQLLMAIGQVAGGGDGAAAGAGADGNPNGEVSEEQEEKLLQMAKALIQGVSASTAEQGEKQQLNDALSALTRVEQLSKQHDENESDPEKAAKVKEELELIAERLSKQANESAEKFKEQAGGGGDVSASSLPPLPNGGTPPEMTDAERQEFAKVMHQIFTMQQQQQQQQNAGGATNSSSSNNNAANATSGLAAAAAAAASSGAGGGGEGGGGGGLTPNSNDMFNYSVLIYRTFGLIAEQYRTWFDPDNGEGRNKRQAGEISDAVWARYTAQKETVDELLRFKDRHLQILNAARSSSSSNNDTAAAGDETKNEEEEERRKEAQRKQDELESELADELREIVERLGRLGEPPPGFKS